LRFGQSAVWPKRAAGGPQRAISRFRPTANEQLALGESAFARGGQTALWPERKCGSSRVP